ncbi:MAG: PAS domain S-box-containing protein [Sulfurimonas sp.]|jgi:PAS domain S-box-containing protein|uniref:PAS domain-containing protein n=1 Tax=Sulfurimonas sp. TaxID=2022749 RepID=UPI0039E50DD4
MEIFMNEDDLIVSKTDLNGKITYGNEYFIKMSGYSEQELLDSPHNILRHENMPRVVFQLLWERIKNKKSINAYVKNKTKNGDFYWVFANVTASLDKNENLIGYYSVRRKPSSKALQAIEELYKELRQAESKGGIQESSKVLEEKLHYAGISYDEFIIALQK